MTKRNPNDSGKRKATTPRQRTPAQRAASRRNGARSGGPKTFAGKCRSRRNALKHGAYAQTLRLWLTDPADRRRYETLLASLREKYTPDSPLEEALIEQLADDLRRLHWLRELEQASLAPDTADAASQLPVDQDEGDGLDELHALESIVAMLGRGCAGGATMPPHTSHADTASVHAVAELMITALAEAGDVGWPEALQEEAAPLAQRLRELGLDEPAQLEVALGQDGAAASEARRNDTPRGELPDAVRERLIELFERRADAVRDVMRHQRAERLQREMERFEGLGAVHRQQTAAWRRIQGTIRELETLLRPRAAVEPTLHMDRLHKIADPLRAPTG